MIWPFAYSAHRRRRCLQRSPWRVFVQCLCIAGLVGAAAGLLLRGAA